MASEMKAFFTAPEVRKATVMIDWSARNVDLFGSEGMNPKMWPLVTRALQSHALLPHTLIKDVGAYCGESSEVADSDLACYSNVEAAVRDAYDAFLDGLERFSGYIDTGLLTQRDLQPYLGYWLDDIASRTSDLADGEWTCSLLAYIAFYRYTGVQALFDAFGHDITPKGKLFKEFLGQVADPLTAAALRKQFLPKSGRA